MYHLPPDIPREQCEVGLGVDMRVFVDGEHVATMLPSGYFAGVVRGPKVNHCTASEIALSWQVAINPESRGVDKENNPDGLTPAERQEMLEYIKLCLRTP